MEKNCTTCEYEGYCVAKGDSCGGYVGNYDYGICPHWLGYPYWEEKHKKSDKRE